MASKLLQSLVDGVSVGSLYALIALGYTMVYGVLKFINFAHGDVFMLGAWFALTIGTLAGLKSFGADPAIANNLWIAAVVLGLLGVSLWAVSVQVRKRLAPQQVLLHSGLHAVEGVSLLARSSSLCVLLLIFGVYLSWGLVKLGGWSSAESAPPIIAGGGILLAVMGICGVTGYTIEKVAYRPLRDAPRLNALITAIGVSLFIQNLAQLPWFFGTDPQRMPGLLPNTSLATIAGVEIKLIDVVVIISAVVLMVALEILIFRTKLGLALRSVAYDRRLAQLMGVPADLVVSMTFVIGSILAAAAGLLYALKYPGLNQPSHPTWILLGLKAFVAAVVGGIGNIRGAMLGGLLIGLVEVFGAAYLNPGLRDVYVFSLLIIILLFKPTGLLGKTVTEKV